MYINSTATTKYVRILLWMNTNNKNSFLISNFNIIMSANIYFGVKQRWTRIPIIARRISFLLVQYRVVNTGLGLTEPIIYIYMISFEILNISLRLRLTPYHETVIYISTYMCGPERHKNAMITDNNRYICYQLNSGDCLFVVNSIKKHEDDNKSLGLFMYFFRQFHISLFKP